MMTLQRYVSHYWPALLLAWRVVAVSYLIMLAAMAALSQNTIFFVPVFLRSTVDFLFIVVCLAFVGGFICTPRKQHRLLKIAGVLVFWGTLLALRQAVAHHHPEPVASLALPSGTQVMLAKSNEYDRVNLSVWRAQRWAPWTRLDTNSLPISLGLRLADLGIVARNRRLVIGDGAYWVSCYKLPNFDPCSIATPYPGDDEKAYLQLRSRQITALIE